MGKPSISRGHQLGEASIAAPKLVMPAPRDLPAAVPSRLRGPRRPQPAPRPASFTPEGPSPVRLRNSGDEPERARFPLEAAPEPAVPAPASPEYHLVHDRLTAIERLKRLRDQGALTEEEFVAEKAIILSLPADELVLHVPAPQADETANSRPAANRNPPLVRRLFGWRFLMLALGLALLSSYLTQPRETVRILQAGASLFGF